MRIPLIYKLLHLPFGIAYSVWETWDKPMKSRCYRLDIAELRFYLDPVSRIRSGNACQLKMSPGRKARSAP